MEETQRVPIQTDFDNEDGPGITVCESVPTPSRLNLYEKALMLQKKKELMSQLIPKECTFSPNLSKTSVRRFANSAPSPSFRPDSGLPVHERLYKVAEIHRERLEMRKAQSTQNLFSPAITPRAARLIEADKTARLEGRFVESPGERLYNVSHEIRARIEEKRKELVEQEATFQPQITAKAKALVREGSAADRLYNPEWVRNRLRPENNDPSISKSASFTFRPKVNVSSHAILESAISQPSPLVDAKDIQDISTSDVPDKLRYVAMHTSPLGSTDSFTRLYNHALAKNEAHAIRREIDKSSIPEDCTFTPNTKSPRKSRHRTGAIVTNADSEGSTFDRLYMLGQERQKRREELAKKGEEERNALDSECTFEPKISETSRKIAELLSTVEYDEEGNPRPVKSRHEALYLDGVAKAREKVERELLEYFDIDPNAFVSDNSDDEEPFGNETDGEEATISGTHDESINASPYMQTPRANRSTLNSTHGSSRGNIRSTQSFRSTTSRIGSASPYNGGLRRTPTSPMAPKAWADSLRS